MELLLNKTTSSHPLIVSRAVYNFYRDRNSNAVLSALNINETYRDRESFSRQTSNYAVWIPIFTLITPLGGYLVVSDKICHESHKRFISPFDSLFIQQITHLQHVLFLFLSSISLFFPYIRLDNDLATKLCIFTRKSQCFSSCTL